MAVRCPIIVALSFAFGGSAFGQMIPADRRIIWQDRVGIPNGIPVYPVAITVTSAPYNADNTGAADATAAINSAISACPTDQAVYVPPGTYKISGAINLKRHCALRGAGTNTIFALGDDGGIVIQTANTDGVATGIASGYVKDSTNLVLSATSTIGVGEPIVIDELNDTSLVDRDGSQGCSYCSRDSGTRVLQFIHLVTAKSGNTLTIQPPMPITLKSAFSPQVYKFVSSASDMMEWAGVEDLKLNHVGESGTTDGNAIEIRDSKYCWVKNVEIANLCEAGVYMLRAYRCEIRGCYLHHASLSDFSSSKAYGSTMWWGSSYNLIEDNIGYYLRHAFVIEGGGAGNVFAYNYSDRMFDQFYPDTDYLMGDLLLHGSHPIMNLYEGNVARVLYFDNVHGSGSHNTAFRNWLVGESQGVNVPWMDWSLTPVGIDENHLSNNIVGNVLGKASHGPGIYEAQTISSSSSTHYVYILGQLDRANLSTAPGWAEVRGSLLRHYNWDFNTTTNGGIRYDDTGMTSDLNLPNSMYRSSKPVYFGSLPWPPFDPRNPAAAQVTSIPAGYRFVNGRNPSTSPTPLITVSPTTLNYGSVFVGSSKDLNFLVQNVGLGTLTGSVSVTAPFSIIGSNSYSLTNGVSQQIAVRYSPTQLGTDVRTVTFTGGGGATASVTGSGSVPLQGLSFRAIDGTITAPFNINSDQTISQSIDVDDPTLGGRAAYAFTVTNAGPYVVLGEVYVTATDSDSFFVNIDAEPTSPDMIWDIPIYAGFTNQVVTWRGLSSATKIWTLAAGGHQLIIRGRESNVKLRQVTIAPYRQPMRPGIPADFRFLGSQ